MGKCCSMEVLSEGGIAGAPVAEALKGLKGSADYKKRYKEGKLAGSSKKVLIVKNELGHQYVCRKIPKDEAPCKSKKGIDEHVSRVASVEHPHICKFVEGFDDGGFFYLIYEKADPTTVFDMVQAKSYFGEEDAAETTRQITAALATAHQAGVPHGRLTPSAVILAPPDADDDEDEAGTAQVKVCDVGQGFVFRPTSFGGHKSEVVVYSPPEVLWEEMVGKEDGTLPKDAELVDMWGLGAIVFHMLTGRPPFQAANEAALIEKIKSQAVTFEDAAWTKLSADAKSAVEQLLKITPGLRPSSAYFLRHPWIKLVRETMPRKRMIKLLENLRTNIQEGQFKKFVLRVIADHLPKDGKQVEAIERAFRVLDKNGDGVLSVKEICAGFRKYPELEMDDLESIFASLDRDGTGTINISEFIASTMDQNRVNTRNNLWQVFNTFDKDKGGKICVDEIERLLREVEGGLLGKDQINDLCKEVRAEITSITGESNDLDWEHFEYIMTVPPGQQDCKKAWNANVYSIVWKAFGKDCYEVRHLPLKTWHLEQAGASPRSPRSVYQKRGVDRQSALESGTDSKGQNTRSSTRKRTQG